MRLNGFGQTLHLKSGGHYDNSDCLKSGGRRNRCGLCELPKSAGVRIENNGYQWRSDALGCLVRITIASVRKEFMGELQDGKVCHAATPAARRDIPSRAFPVLASAW
jgi:hypothetical protein